MKRFQKSNWLIKIWRYRHYMYVPFKWLVYQFIIPFPTIDPETNQTEIMSGKNLWKLLVGIAQIDMNWFYTMEEVKEEMERWKRK